MPLHPSVTNKITFHINGSDPDGGLSPENQRSPAPNMENNPKTIHGNILTTVGDFSIRVIWYLHYT
jgi:hypothetical protein